MQVSPTPTVTAYRRELSVGLVAAGAWYYQGFLK